MILQQVQRYMEDLAEGTDPAGGGRIPAGSVLRETDMVDCFRHVAAALRQELDSREQDQEERVTLAVFLAETLRELGYTGNRYFLNNAATEWLTREGYTACGQDADGNMDHHNCRVTPKGRAAGLTESEPYEDGYIAILCGSRAKELILENLEQIMADEQAQWEPLLACLTAEWREQISCFAEPVSLKTILDRVNSRLPAGLTRRFISLAVYAWLIRNRLLEERTNDNSKKQRFVTETGRQNGFTEPGKLAPLAQRFLLDHLADIARDLASGEAYRIPEVQE